MPNSIHRNSGLYFIALCREASSVSFSPTAPNLELMYKLIAGLSVLIIFFSMQQVSAQTGYIEVRCEAGVKVFLDDAFKGIATKEEGGIILSDVLPGEHSVRVVKTGFAAQSIQVAVKGGRVSTIRVSSFVPKVEVSEEGESEERVVKLETGKLIVQTLPTECSLTVSLLGITGAPKTKDLWTATEIPPGEYEVLARGSGRVLICNFRVEPNKTTRLFLDILKMDAQVQVGLPLGLTPGMSSNPLDYSFSELERMVVAKIGETDKKSYLMSVLADEMMMRPGALEMPTPHNNAGIRKSLAWWGLQAGQMDFHGSRVVNFSIEAYGTPPEVYGISFNLETEDALKAVDRLVAIMGPGYEVVNYREYRICGKPGDVYHTYVWRDHDLDCRISAVGGKSAKEVLVSISHSSRWGALVKLLQERAPTTLNAGQALTLIRRAASDMDDGSGTKSLYRSHFGNPTREVVDRRNPVESREWYYFTLLEDSPYGVYLPHLSIDFYGSSVCGLSNDPFYLREDR